MPLNFNPVGNEQAMPYTAGGSSAANPNLLGAAAMASSGRLVEFEPQGATNFRIPVKIYGTGVAQQVPGVHVPPGARVILTGMNGQTTNAQNVFAGLSPEELNNAGRLISPAADVDFPVDNTGEIWIKGTAGDGVMVNITSPRIG